MLKHLSISNFVLIEHLQLNFDEGFSVITGETGSGKSILLGGLNLILGERADYSLIKNNEKKSTIEAEFVIADDRLKQFFEENDLDYDKELIIRREISPNGKSRAFINDTPVSLQVLKTCCEQLVYIHSQHENTALKDKTFQFEILDYLAGTYREYLIYFVLFEQVNKLRRQINQLQVEVDSKNKEQDYLIFQISELENLSLEKINYKQLEEELNLIDNYALIQGFIAEVQQVLSDEKGVQSNINYILAKAQRNTGLHPVFKEIESRLTPILIELKELGFELDAMRDMEEVSFDKKEKIEEQLSNFNAVCAKHKCQTQEELVSLLSSFKQVTSSVVTLEIELQEKKKELSNFELDLQVKAANLSENRIKAIPSIENEISLLLKELKLEQAEFKIVLAEVKELSGFGKDEISFLFSANKGMPLQTIEKAASGGEISRLMLIFHLLLSTKKDLPTLILDEIDTGVSGEVANKIGELLHKMGKNLQALTITHLPQVAAKASHHYLVEKHTNEDLTTTFVNKLSQENAITEIARLLSGENISQSAIDNAKVLMGVS